MGHLALGGGFRALKLLGSSSLGNACGRIHKGPFVDCLRVREVFRAWVSFRVQTGRSRVCKRVQRSSLLPGSFNVFML